MNKISVSIFIILIIQAVMVAAFQNPAEKPPEPENIIIEGIPLGERVRSESGGYSLRPIPGFAFQADEAGTSFLSWQEGAMLFLMEGGTLDSGVVEEELSRFLLLYANNLPEFQIVSAPYFYTSDSYVFESVDTMFSNDTLVFDGVIIARQPSPDQYFIMFATAPQEVWDEIGQDVLDALTSEIEFFEPTVAPLQ